jgi:hypothetical protein
LSTDARKDAFAFYAISMISFLESAVSNYVDSLQPYFGDSPEAWRWLCETWQQEESAHGRITREFVNRQWPEFEWETAYKEFLRMYTPRCRHHLLQPTRGLEALARCVTEAGAAMMYRCIGAYTTDPELKVILDHIGRDEVRHYTYFRDLFDRDNAVERNSFLQKAGTVLARSNLVREEDIAMAFRPLNDAWSSPMPFTPFNYAMLLKTAGRVMSQHFPIRAAKRMLFRPLVTGRAWERAGIAVMAVIVQRRFQITA